MSEFTEHQPSSPESEFENKKTLYFSKLALQTRKAMALHKERGLWLRSEGQRDWGNVTEHCLVETARVKELSAMLDLPNDVQHDLELAAAAHDYFKKDEKDIVTAAGLSWESFDQADERSEQLMRQAGFSDRVVNLAHAVGHSAIHQAEILLQKSELTVDETAWLVLHYVDDYTSGDEWVRPESDDTAVGRNALDDRIDKNEANDRYRVLNQDGRKRFGGRTTFEAQRSSGHAIERWLAEKIKGWSGSAVESLRLPELIDQRIRQKIEQ